MGRRAVIILLAVIVGGVIWYRYYGHAAPAPAQPSRTNINVSIPTPTSGGDSAGTSDGTTNQ